MKIEEKRERVKSCCYKESESYVKRIRMKEKEGGQVGGVVKCMATGSGRGGGGGG